MRLLWALLLPVTAALLLDRLLGLTPWLTLAAAAVCIPLATVLVSKAALRDLDRVIALVAPPESVERNTGAEDAPLLSQSSNAGEQPVDPVNPVDPVDHTPSEAR